MMKKITRLSLGALFLFCSCVDNRYDLANKDLSLDVKIPGNKITLPVGSLKPVRLDSIIDLEQIDVLKKDDKGVYCISMSDTISPIEEHIDPIKLSVAPINKSVDINFTEAEITTVHINGVHPEPAKFKVPEISFDELNSKLPVLVSSADKELLTDELDAAFDLLEKLGSSFPPTPVNLNQTFSIEGQSVACDFEYVLPSQIETIKSIKLASRDDLDNTSKGTLVEVVVTHPEALSNVNKSIGFNIDFPDHFVLSRYSDEYKLSNDNHSISVDGLNANGNSTIVRFYIDRITDIGDSIKGGVLRYSDNIKYTVDYNVNGEVIIDSKLKRDDLIFNVSLNVPLAFSDVTGRTKDFEVDFNPVDMNLTGHFDNLQHIDTIFYITFKQNENWLQFITNIDTGWSEEISFKEGYALKIAFPENLVIDDENSQYDGKGTDVVYSIEDHAFYVYDLKAFSSAKWNLAIERYNLNTVVNDGVCDIKVNAGIYVVDKAKQKTDKLMIKGFEMESLASTLENMKGEKVAEFEMLGTDLGIEDAVIHTDVIKSDLNTSTVFELHEEIPSEIGRIDSIGLVNDVTMRLDVNIVGLEELDTDIHFDVKMAVPSFLKLKSSNNNSSNVELFKVQNDTLYLKADFHPKEDKDLFVELLCTGLDFTGEKFDFKGYMPDEGQDGKFYINYKDSIKVVGEASIDGMEFHSEVLDKNKNIKFDVDFTLNDIELKTFHGIYRGEIGEINETVDLGLGEEFDFLRDDSTKIKLSEPQIEIELDNSVCVPINVELSMAGRDANNNEISTSLISKTIKIHPAEYKDGTTVPRKTRLFITNDTAKLSKAGYDNIEIPNLATLLEKIPNSIDFSVKPLIDQSVTHHIDITKPITFGGNYSVVVPLRFDELNICYSDTISGLSESLGEELDMFSNVSLKVKMKVLNTMPLGLSLTLQPLDVNGEPVDDITIDPVMIKAGSGGDVSQVDNAELIQDLTIAVSSKKLNLSALDKMIFTIETLTDRMLGSEGLKGEQGLKISDIVFEVAGDIEMDFNE